MLGILQDLRYAFRMLMKHPGFSAIAVLTVALGIGANTAIFSVVNAVLLRPLPYPEADRLTLLNESSEQIPDMSISMANFNDWRAQNSVFESMLAYQGDSTVFTGKGVPEHLRLRRITAGFTPTMRVEPILGRTLNPDDDKVGAARVAILGEGFWERRFGRDQSVLGQQIILDAEPYTIIGVYPSKLHTSMRQVDAFTSLWRLEDKLGGETRRGNHPGIYAYARLVLTGIAFGIVPALQVSKSECADTLREESRTSAGNRSTWLRDGLVVAELSVSIVLLTGAGLMVRSLSALLHQNPGFDRTNLLTFVVNLPEASYKDDPAIRQFAKRLSNALQELPGVKETAVISKLPVTGNGNTIRFLIEGRPKPKGTEDEGSIRDVSTSYFSVMKIPILKGRTYEPQDAESSAPQRIVINQAFADRYLAGENPIGKRVRFTFSDSQPYQEIIGIVANESTEGLDAAMQPIMYSSFERGPDPAFYVVMRTPEDPQIVISSARLALRGIDPGVPMIEPRSMEAVISDSYAVFLRRFPSRLITGFAVLALILAVIGLYGQISFAVAQRTREIGVRMALGAEYRDVLRLIVGKGLLLTSAGVLIGIAAALALTRLLTGLLFGVTPNDPSTFAAVVVLLATVSLAASLVPARRAARIDPIVALRYE
jgi:MacB-like periplasmic core domain/FtsX-like permease family